MMIACILRCLVLLSVVFSLPQMLAATDADKPGIKQVWGRELIDSTARRQKGDPEDLAGLAFLNAEDLLVFQNVKVNQKLTSREKLDPDAPFQLQISVLDVKSGTAKVSKEWATRPGDWDAKATQAGVVVRTYDVLRFLTPSLSEIHSTKIEPAPKHYLFLPNSEALPQVLNFRIMSSADRSRLLLIQEAEGARLATVLDGASLRVVNHWTEKPERRFYASISNAAVAAIDRNSESLLVKGFGQGAWSKMPRQSNRIRTVAFVNEDMLASGCNEMLLETLDGNVVLRSQVGKRNSLEKVTVSTDESAMAAAFNDVHGGGLFDTDISRSGVTIVVYDMLRKIERARVEVSPLPYLCNFDLALSPDGSRLAVLSDRTVTVYSVPQFR
jgi:hypothetical protein